MRLAAAIAPLVALIGPRAAHAQLPQVRGYYLNVPTVTDSTDFATGGLGDLNRLRLMTEPALGPVVLQVAYEQVLAWSGRAETDPGSGFESVVPGGLEWLDLQWTIEQTDHIDWRHRFDRLNAHYAPGDLFEFIVGRQTISWATTLFLTPADPFVPFDPSDPFREYRAGVDAFRAQAFPSPLSDLDFVVRPTKRTAADGTEVDELTVAGRGRTVWKEWEVSAWAGALYEEPALAIGAAGGIGQIALRSEALLTRNEDDPVLAATVGLDGRLDALGRDLYLVFEYQYGGFGAASASELSEVVRSDAFARGQLQVLGRNETVARGSYQIHPLWTTDLLVQWNLSDGSLLVSPRVSYSVAREAVAQGGIFVGLGDSVSEVEGEIPSEYGIVPTTLFLSLSVFF